jgi:AcrR family transcriptional regulator
MARAKSVNSPWNTTRDREAEREAKREAVLAAAAQAFAENGYYHTSLDSVAARLGVTKPTLYYYASSKDDLVSAIAGRALDQILAIAGDDQASGLLQLKHLIRRFVEVNCGDFGRCWTDILSARITGETGRKLRAGMREIDGRIRALIELGHADGSIARCDVKLTTFMIVGAVNDVSRWFDESGPLSASVIAEKFANQFAAGLEARSTNG